MGKDEKDKGNNSDKENRGGSKYEVTIGKGATNERDKKDKDKKDK